mmetsp:Transcript_75594/g.148370  ORF Transcript_75594/g.148370 Transcript_75594/m.148370 type:complete len:201 (-) Transcript_75594:189-791(-)
MHEYTSAGLPGCIDSTDVVHCSWERRHAKNRNIYAGKEKFPTVAYEMTVNHKGRIQAVGRGFYGTCNDKTIVRFDAFVVDLHERRKYEDVEYTLTNADGLHEIMKGCYVITDNGYHMWRCLQCPISHPVYPDENAWTKRVESCRKDIECLFGIMKKRWTILKTAMRMQSKDEIDAIVMSCCILHNTNLMDSTWTGIQGML